MNTQTKWIVGIIVLALVVWGVVASTGEKKVVTDEPIKIGFIGPFTGSAAVFGEFMQRGIDIALESLPPDVAGRIEIIAEDDKCNGPDGISALQKLINIHNIKYVIGPLCNAVSVSTEQLFETNNIISLSSGLPSNQIAEMGPYHFTLAPEIKDLLKTTSEYITEQGIDSIGVFYVKDAFGEENLIQFRNYMDLLGGNIVFAEGLEKGSNDVKTQVLKLSEKDVDAIMIMTSGGTTISILKELDVQQLGDLPVFSIHAIQAQEILDGAGKLAEGIIYSYPASSKETKQSEIFTEKYIEKYGEIPELYSTNVYDSLIILTQAIKECGYENSGCVQKTLANTHGYRGATGVLSLDERGVAVFDEVQLRIVKDGEFVPL